MSQISLCRLLLPQSVQYSWQKIDAELSVIISLSQNIHLTLVKLKVNNEKLD